MSYISRLLVSVALWILVGLIAGVASGIGFVIGRDWCERRKISRTGRQVRVSLPRPAEADVTATTKERSL